MERALARYLRHHKAEGSTVKTLEWHSNSIGHFCRFLVARHNPASGTTTLDDLTLDAALDWIDSQREQGLAQKTVQTRVTSLKAFSHWLVAEAWLTKDPLVKLKRPKVDDTPKDTLAPAQVDALLTSCDRKTLTGSRDYAIMLLLFSTGLRDAELRSLVVTDIDWSQGLITIRRGKGGKFRVVPLGQPVEKALDRYLRHPKRPERATAVFLSDAGEPLTYTALRSLLRRHGDKVGVKANQHKWRHSAAITYLRAGGRVETLRAMLGHAKLDQTLHYARIAGVDLIAAHATADPARSLKVRV